MTESKYFSPQFGQIWAGTFLNTTNVLPRAVIAQLDRLTAQRARLVKVIKEL